MTRPNVVLFVTHDTGCHLSPYGIATVQTPHAERLAAEGVRFSRSFCTTPLCSPSRAALTTGRYPHQNGVRGLTGNEHGAFCFHAGEKHAAAHFREAGYESVLCNFEHESRHWEPLGFHRTINGSGGWYNHSGKLADARSEITRWLGERDAGRPFYLQIGCHETHRAWTKNDTPPDDSLGLTVPSYLNDIPEVRREVAEFQGAVKKLDEGLGGILDAIDRAGLRENTIFVYTSDHGIDFPRAKGTMYDPGIGVFLFMRYPAGGWAAGAVRDEMISNVDVLPTLLEACGIARAPNIAGRSFLPLLTGGEYQPHQAVFAEKDYHDTWDPTRCVRTDRHKYIRYFDVCLFDDLRGATMTQRHFFRHPWRRKVVEELYDLQSDPDEVHNLAQDEAHGPTVRAMRQTLLRWMRATGDDLLNGTSRSPFYRRMLEALLEADD